MTFSIKTYRSLSSTAAKSGFDRPLPSCEDYSIYSMLSRNSIMVDIMYSIICSMRPAFSG